MGGGGSVNKGRPVPEKGRRAVDHFVEELPGGASLRPTSVTPNIRSETQVCVSMPTTSLIGVPV